MKHLFKLWRVCTAIMLCGVLVAGCGGGGGGGSDSPTVSDPAPTVVYTTPVNDATDVGTASKITVTFSEAMNAATITTGSFKLENITTGTPTTVTLSSVDYDTTNKIATITPSTLVANQNYRVTVNAVVQDTAGKTMQSAYAWTFKTSSTVGVAPQLSSQAPVSGATNVGTNTAIAMSFTKPMDINTFNASAFTLKRTSDASTVAGTFSMIGQVVVFTPNAPLAAAGVQYTATVTTQAKDTSGISLAAPVSWSFTTGSGADVKRPVGDILQASPTGTVADLRPAMSIPFNEPVYPFLFGTIDGKVVEVEFDYSPSGTTTVTMTPTADRAPGTYTTGIAVSDLAHNKSYTYTWSFTIVSPP